MKATGRIILATILALSGTSAGASAEKPDPDEVVEAPGFRGTILGMGIATDSLAVVVDVSESMNRHLPAVRETLRRNTPHSPTLHVDGCGVESPDPRPRIRNGTAPETITAITILARHTTARSILWITDMGDAPNHAGLEALERACAEHGIQLFLLSVGDEPPPSIRRIVEGTEGFWQLTARSGAGD